MTGFKIICLSENIYSYYFKISKNAEFITALNLFNDVTCNYKAKQKQNKQKKEARNKNHHHHHQKKNAVLIGVLSLKQWKWSCCTLPFFLQDLSLQDLNHCSCCLSNSGISGALCCKIVLHICTILSTNIHLVSLERT